MLYICLLLEYGDTMQTQVIQRKVVEIKGSYYVNIPKQIAETLQLKKGAIINIYPNSTGIAIGILTVYSIGYEKRSIEELISILKKYRITQVIDLREKAFSRIPAYRKEKLKEILQNNDIFYYNFKQLGAPASLRKALNESKDYREFFCEYEEYLNTQHLEYELLKKVISTAPTVLLCYERDPEFCHRKIITEKLKKDGFEVIHL